MYFLKIACFVNSQFGTVQLTIIQITSTQSKIIPTKPRSRSGKVDGLFTGSNSFFGTTSIYIQHGHIVVRLPQCFLKIPETILIKKLCSNSKIAHLVLHVTIVIPRYGAAINHLLIIIFAAVVVLIIAMQQGQIMVYTLTVTLRLVRTKPQVVFYLVIIDFAKCFVTISKSLLFIFGY